jgi:Domain of unknown function (DUF4926)
MKPNVDLLDVVELHRARRRQPAGAIGAVVELFATEALVEITDEEGSTNDLLSVPYEGPRVRPSAQRARRSPAA